MINEFYECTPIQREIRSLSGLLGREYRQPARHDKSAYCRDLGMGRLEYMLRSCFLLLLSLMQAGLRSSEWASDVPPLQMRWRRDETEYSVCNG
jgi:hypothetical protein